LDETQFCNYFRQLEVGEKKNNTKEGLFLRFSGHQRGLRGDLDKAFPKKGNEMVKGLEHTSYEGQLRQQ